MKNLAVRLFAFVLILMMAVPAYSMSNGEGSSSSGFNEPVFSDNFGFTAELVDGNVKMAWDDYAPEGFMYYKIMRSATNANPVYPDDQAIGVHSDREKVTFIDYDVPHGELYYRVCVVNQPHRHCSNVVKIMNEGEEDHSDDVQQAKIHLNGKMTDVGVLLEWKMEEGSAPKGFKVTRSHETDPKYPDHSISYLGDSSIRSFIDKGVYSGKTYHYRICRYTGSGCDSYSNDVSLAVDAEFSSKDEYKKDEHKKEHENLEEKHYDDSELEALRKEVAQLKNEVKQLRAAFKDVEQHAYKKAIDHLRESGVVQGYDDGSFKPDNSINRAEFMKIVMEAKYADEVKGEHKNCFADVHDEWFTSYVCLAKDKGIVQGYGDGKFQPAKNISFVEAAKILAEVYGLEISEGEQWYEGYVKALQKDSYVPNTIKSLDKFITRAEMAELIWRIKEQKKDQESSTLIDGQ